MFFVSSSENGRGIVWGNKTEESKEKRNEVKQERQTIARDDHYEINHLLPHTLTQTYIKFDHQVDQQTEVV